jgi:hypothetical protein
MPRTIREGVSQPDSRRSFSKSLWTGLIVIAAVISSRRMSGQFSQDLSNLEACSAVTLAVVTSLLAYVLYWSTGRSHRESQPLILVGVVTLVPPFALGLALQPNPSAFAVSYLVSLFLVTCMLIFAMGEMIVSAPHSNSSASHPTLPAQVGSLPLQTSQSETLIKGDAFCSESDPKDDPLVTQRLKRSVFDRFQEQIEGEISVALAAGQKLAVVHVPFVPPLSARPHIECRIDTDAAVRFKVASINSYGIRIEIRRSGSDTEATSMQLCFTATTPAVHSEAA